MEFHLYNLYFFFQDTTFQYYVLYFGISFLGFYAHELYYSFHLLDVIQRFPTLTNVIRSVTSNAEQLLMTCLLTVIIIYIFTTLSFFYLQDTVYDFNNFKYDSSWVGESKCTSMFTCFMTILEYGMSYGGGIGDYTTSIDYHDQLDKYLVKLCHDTAFFIIIKIILMNILLKFLVFNF